MVYCTESSDNYKPTSHVAYAFWWQVICWTLLVTTCWLVIGQLFWLNALLRLAGHDQIYTIYISYFWVNHWNPLRRLYLSGLELWKISTTWYFRSNKLCFCFVAIPDYGEAIFMPHSQINWDCKEYSFPYQEDGVTINTLPTSRSEIWCHLTAPLLKSQTEQTD